MINMKVISAKTRPNSMVNCASCEFLLVEHAEVNLFIDGTCQIFVCIRCSIDIAPICFLFCFKVHLLASHA